MKKQYMDFAPRKTQTVKKQVKAASQAQAKPVAKKSASARTVAKKPALTAIKGSIVEPRTTKEVKRNSKIIGFKDEKKRLGKVENLNTRFVKSDVPKRPLNRASHFTTGKTGVAAVKAKKVGNRASVSVKSVEKPVEKSAKKLVEKPKVSETYQPPKNPFINQGKVAKRPLSKNVYAKKPVVAPAKEAPKGPVTIISKPEKQAHVGMIITIILTIILGAAAGTVAFLLLPK